MLTVPRDRGASARGPLAFRLPHSPLLTTMTITDPESRVLTPTPRSYRVPSEPIARILAGHEHVVSFAGRSQYGPDGGGVSACGLAALNFARIIMGKECEGIMGEQILQEMMKQETAEVSSSCYL
jgi:hypothetical protein